MLVYCLLVGMAYHNRRLEISSRPLWESWILLKKNSFPHVNYQLIFLFSGRIFSNIKKLKQSISSTLLSPEYTVVPIARSFKRKISILLFVHLLFSGAYIICFYLTIKFFPKNFCHLLCYGNKRCVKLTHEIHFL